MMQKRNFGKTGLKVSPLGFGAAPIGFLETERADALAVLNLLLDHGVNLIDTAACYPGSEIMLGDTIANRRDECILVTKAGHVVDGASGKEFSPQVITESIDRSLKRLRTDRLDVVLIHSCKKDLLEKGDALGALLKAKAAGKIRFAGYSGDNEAATYAAGLPGIEVIETSVNIADQVNIDSVLAAAAKHGHGVEAKRPIANAAWRSVDEQRGIYKNYASEYKKRLTAMKLDPVALGIDGPPQKAWPELALRFTLSFPAVSCAIIGTTSLDNASANLAAAEKGPLPDATVRAIRDAFAKAQPAPGAWTGQT